MPDSPPHPLGRTARRLAVLSLYGGFLAAAGVTLAFSDLKPWPIAAAALAGIAVSAASLLLLVRRTSSWSWGMARDRRLDEFERSARNAAHRHAYAIVAGAAALCLAFGFFGPDGSATLAAAGWLLLALTLPAAMLTWMEKEPVEID